MGNGIIEGEKNKEKENIPVQKTSNSFDDMLKDAPAEVKQIIKRVFSMEVSGQRVVDGQTQFLTALSDKITESHIDKIIESSAVQDRRQFDFSIFLKICNIVLVLLGIAVFVWLTVFLAKEKESLYMDILKTVFAFLGGLGIGFGIKNNKRNEK